MLRSATAGPCRWKASELYPARSAAVSAPKMPSASSALTVILAVLTTSTPATTWASLTRDNRARAASRPPWLSAEGINSSSWFSSDKTFLQQQRTHFFLFIEIIPGNVSQIMISYPLSSIPVVRGTRLVSLSISNQIFRHLAYLHKRYKIPERGDGKR